MCHKSKAVLLALFLASSSGLFAQQVLDTASTTTPKQQLLDGLDSLQQQLDSLSQINSEQEKSLTLLEQQSKDLNSLFNSISLENKILWPVAIGLACTATVEALIIVFSK